MSTPGSPGTPGTSGAPGTGLERPATGANTTVDAPDAGSVPTAEPALAAAKAPVGTGASPWLALLMALALIALGGVGIQEALVRSGALAQSSWTRTAVDSADGISSETWMLPVFVAVALMGVLLLVAALKPRPRRTLTLDATTGVYLRTGDLGRMVGDLLEGAEGVTDVASRVGQRRLRLTATTLAPKDRNAALAGDLRERLEPLLRALKSPPKVTVNVRHEDLS